MIYFWMGKLWKQLNMVELFSRYACFFVDVFLKETQYAFVMMFEYCRVTIQDSLIIFSDVSGW